MSDWLSGWQYRKSHEVQGSSAGAQTNYQIKIIVHKGVGTDSGEHVYCNNHCRDDFGDIRFTDSDGVTELDYWLESYTSGDQATFWVEVPSIPASPDTATIYIYYGNPSATTTSNGENTFISFNDFDTDDWTDVGSLIYVDVANSYLYYKAYRSSTKHHSYKSVPVGTSLRAISFEIKPVAYSGSFGSFRLGFSKNAKNFADFITGDHAVYIQHYDGYQLYLSYAKDEPWTANSPDSPYTMTANTKYYCELIRTSPTNVQLKVWTDIGRTNLVHTANLTIPSDLTFNYLLASNLADDLHPTEYTEGNIDTVRVRKYVEPEPSHGAWGSEETPGVAHEVTVSESLGLADNVVKRADYGTLVSGAEKLGLTESITKRVDYKTLLSGTEKLGIIDEAAVQTVILLLAAEKLGLVDGVTKRVDYKTLVGGAEKLGLLDGLLKRVDYRTLQSGVESLGLADTALTKRQVYVLTAEQLGLVSHVKPTARYHIYIEEKLGLIEVGRVGKPIYIKVTEKLGLIDREKILLTIYTPAVTVPANTPKDAPVTYLLLVEEDYITSIDVYFPPGCCGLCRVQAYYGSEQIAPKPTGADFRGDNMLVRCPLRWKVPEKPCPIRFVLWNLDDTYSHTPIIFVTTAEEEQVKPYKPVSEFVNLFKRLLGIRG